MQADGYKSPGKSLASIRAGTPQPCCNALPHCAPVSGSVHSSRSRCGNAARSGCLFEQRLQGMLSIAPGDDPIRQSVRARQQRRFSIKTCLFCGSCQSRERVIAVAAGVGHGERVKLAFRNFNDPAKAREKIANAFAIRAWPTPGKSNRRKAAPTAANRTRHGTGQFHARPSLLPKHAQRHTCGQADRKHSPVQFRDHFSDHAKKLANRTRTNCNDQHVRLLDGSGQIGLDSSRVTLFHIAQLGWIAIVHHQAVFVLSQTQARQHRRRDPPSAEKNDRAHAISMQIANLPFRLHPPPALLRS